jgi:hypothetical protein
MSTTSPKPTITKVYGRVTLILSGVPFLFCCALSIYLVITGDDSLTSPVLSKYYLVFGCLGSAYALISAIVYTYRILSILLLLSFTLSCLLSYLYDRVLLKWVFLTSGVFSVPFIALQFPSVLVLSSVPVEVMCRNPQSFGLVFHMIALFVASYVIIGNFVMVLKRRYKGNVQ